MEITLLNSRTEPLYREFLLGCEHSLFYHSLAYRDLLQDLLGCGSEYYLALEQGEILAALPLMYKQGESGQVVNSLPYYGSNGGVVGNGGPATQGLIDAYNERTSAEDVVAATLVGNPLREFDYGGVRYDHEDYRIGQWTPLDRADDLDGLMRGFESSARRNVNKAFRSGIEVSRDTSKMATLMRMHRENMRSIGGQAKDPRFFELVPRHFVAGEDYEVYVATLEGEIIAGLLLFYYRDTVEYFTPGIDAEYRNLQALPAIISVAMEDAMDREFRQWNWGGTWQSQDGVYRFKRKWGARDLKYDYYIRLNDEAILGRSRQELLSAWPGFYVCPFKLLKDRRDDQC